MNTFTKTIIYIIFIALAAIQPAEAALSSKEAKQVKKIVAKEMTKFLAAFAPFVPGPQGPGGPQGPPGPQGPGGGPQGPPGPQGPGGGGDNGPSFLFATVRFDGLVDEESSFGIASANVRREDAFNHTRYCFSGLPPVSGGQVTLLSSGRSAIRAYDLFVTNDTGQPVRDCPVLVSTSGIGACDPESDATCGDTSLKPLPEDQAFYILLYRAP